MGRSDTVRAEVDMIRRVSVLTKLFFWCIITDSNE